LTNALRYTAPTPRSMCPRWPVRLGLLQPGPWVLCAVSDPSDEVPVSRDAGWFGESGRGLHVVASLSDEWGCTDPGPRGKAAWGKGVRGHVRPQPARVISPRLPLRARQRLK